MEKTGLQVSIFDVARGVWKKLLEKVDAILAGLQILPDLLSMLVFTQTSYWLQMDKTYEVSRKLNKRCDHRKRMKFMLKRSKPVRPQESLQPKSHRSVIGEGPYRRLDFLNVNVYLHIGYPP